LKPPPLKCRGHSGKREENPLPKKTEKEEKKIFFARRGKKTEPEEDNNFKPPQLPHFQPGALSAFSVVDHPRGHRGAVLN
jgi:hypothetical protein